MPKRIGGDPLGCHERLYTKFQAYLFLLIPTALMFLSIFYQLDTMFTYAHGLLLLQILMFGCHMFGLRIVTCIMDYTLEDAPPPWARAKTHMLVKQRHF